MSFALKYFKINETDIKFANCNLCHASISRGGTNSRDFNTSNWIKHIKNRHSTEYESFVTQTATANNPSNPKTFTKQPTLQQTLQRTEKYDHPRAQNITVALTECIALDDQPFQLVDNIGFRHLLQVLEPKYNMPSRRYIAKTVLPKMYSRVAKHLHELIIDVNVADISFTSDIWSSNVCPMSMLSLTAQWIDPNFVLRQAVLHARQFRGLHTTMAICMSFNEMLEKWHTPKEKVHVVIRDNAHNMSKVMIDCGLPSLGCFAHTLQLAINEGLSQRSVIDVVATGRRIVGHFHHSHLSRLGDIQRQLNLPVKRLKQDVQTRWNRTFYMRESLLEQKLALVAFGADFELWASRHTHSKSMGADWNVCVSACAIWRTDPGRQFFNCDSGRCNSNC